MQKVVPFFLFMMTFVVFSVQADCFDDFTKAITSKTYPYPIFYTKTTLPCPISYTESNAGGSRQSEYYAVVDWLDNGAPILSMYVGCNDESPSHYGAVCSKSIVSSSLDCTEEKDGSIRLIANSGPGGIVATLTVTPQEQGTISSTSRVMDRHSTWGGPIVYSNFVQCEPDDPHCLIN